MTNPIAPNNTPSLLFVDAGIFSSNNHEYDNETWCALLPHLEALGVTPSMVSYVADYKSHTVFRVDVPTYVAARDRGALVALWHNKAERTRREGVRARERTRTVTGYDGKARQISDAIDKALANR
jgi:hypothetical protein